jgi:hypothetical protein
VSISLLRRRNWVPTISVGPVKIVFAGMNSESMSLDLAVDDEGVILAIPAVEVDARLVIEGTFFLSAEYALRSLAGISQVDCSESRL